jgi:hypothetical protein
VKDPVYYDAKQFGYPTVAPANVISTQDVNQVPPPEPGFFAQLLGASGGMTSSVKMLSYGLFIGLGIWAYSEFKKNTKTPKSSSVSPTPNSQKGRRQLRR